MKPKNSEPPRRKYAWMLELQGGLQDQLEWLAAFCGRNAEMIAALRQEVGVLKARLTKLRRAGK